MNKAEILQLNDNQLEHLSNGHNERDRMYRKHEAFSGNNKYCYFDVDNCSKGL